MPNIDLIIKLISTQDVRKWDNATLLLWATEMAKLIEDKKTKHEMLDYPSLTIREVSLLPKEEQDKWRAWWLNNA